MPFGAYARRRGADDPCSADPHERAWARTGTKPARQEAIKARAAWPVGQDLPNGAPIAA